LCVVFLHFVVSKMGDARGTIKQGAWHQDANLEKGAANHNDEFEVIQGSLVPPPEFTSFGQYHIAKRNNKYYFYNHTSKDAVLDVNNYRTDSVDKISLEKKKVKLIDEDYM
jgi:hypothetical protein